MLRGGGTVLGVLADVPLGTQEIALEPGDCLIVYTDGITEARPPGGVDQFDEPGVVAVRIAPASSQAAIDGRTFGLSRKTFSGSQRALRTASRPRCTPA